MGGGRGSCVQTEYIPPAFVGASAGDAIVYPLPSNPTDAIGQLFQQARLQNTHAALVYDSSGETLVETYWDGTPPPSTHDTGGSHECSRIVDSGVLQRLTPGTSGTATWDQNRIVSGAWDVPSFGTPYCNTPADTYHINSIMHDDVYGGTCEKYITDYCGVPVQQQDKHWASPDDMNAALQAVYFYGYNSAIGTFGAKGGFADFMFENILCGGIDATIIGQRAGMHLANEIRWKWWELQTPNGNSTDTLGMDTNAMGVNVTTPGGWSTFEYLGAGSQNTQWTGDANNPTANTTYGSYCTNINASNQTPGGYLYGEGAACPSWQNYGNSLQLNVPDNVINAAARLGITPGVTQASGGYYVNVVSDDCPNSPLQYSTL
jgi:hypothetical protein